VSSDAPSNNNAANESVELSRPLPSLIEAREVAVAEAEQRYLKELVSIAGSDLLEACRVAGISRSRLYTLLKKYGIPTSFKTS